MIGHLLTDTVTYAAPDGTTTDGGQPNYSAQAEVAARVEAKSTKVSGPDGVERVGSTVVVSEAEIPVGSRLWLPGDDTTKTNEGRRVIGRRCASPPGGAWTIYEAVL